MRFDRDACVRSLRRVAGGRDEDARGYAASKDAYDREKLVPCCGEEFPDRDPATEPVYTCGTCGKEGFDCCVPGAGACCAECEE